MTSLPLRERDGDSAGLLLVGHGTRDAVGVAEFFDLAQQVAVLAPDVATEACFLEIADPTIAAGVAALVRRGVRRIAVVPVLLFAAGHAKNDIPEAVQAAVATAGIPIEVTQTPALECHPVIVELSAQRFREAVAESAGATASEVGRGRSPLGKPAVAPDDTLLLLVGRGSSDESATAAMHRFAELRARQMPVGRVEVCFVAMAEPSLATALPRVAELPYRRIVVQPHLLFSGELLAEVGAKVAEISRARPAQEWIVTSHLGPDPLLARTIVEVSSQVISSLPT